MLNIIKQKIKKDIVDNKPKVLSSNNFNNYLNIVKHFPAATKEWSNSIYVYNKNALKLLPVYDNIIIKLIKSYFNLYKVRKKTLKNKKINRKISKRIQKRLRRSITRILVSKAELRHTNNSVVVTLYVYNQQERFLLNKISLADPVLGIKNKMFLRRIKYIKLQGSQVLSQLKKERLLLDNKISLSLLNKFRYHESKWYKKFIKKSLLLDRIKIFFLRKLYINKRKFEKSHLVHLNKMLNNIYDKKVEFNIVNLKYIFLNSDIFSQAIAIKIKKKKRVLRVLKSSLRVVKLPFLNKFADKRRFKKIYLTPITSKLKYFDGLKLNSSFNNNFDVLSQLLKVFNNKKKSPNYIERVILRSIRHKSVNGVRIEASGRLSRRFTASRSVFKVKYKGSLKNIDSSYKGLSSVLLRGHARSNIQYTNIRSKTRNGSFGLKGWISSN